MTELNLHILNCIVMIISAYLLSGYLFFNIDLWIVRIDRAIRKQDIKWIHTYRTASFWFAVLVATILIEINVF